MLEPLLITESLWSLASSFTAEDPQVGQTDELG